MISRLRDIDEDTVSARGPRFDLDKVAEAMLGILRTLAGRSVMRYPDSEPPLFGHFRDLELRPFDDAGYAEIAAGFRKIKREAFDVSDFNYVVEFGPFAADLYMLGFETLHGPVQNCLTTFEQDWCDLDPTPMMVLMMRHGMIDLLDEGHRSFLETELERHLPRGIEWESWDVVDRGNGMETSSLAVRFPHESFGAGHGDLRVARYEDLEAGR